MRFVALSAGLALLAAPALADHHLDAEETLVAAHHEAEEQASGAAESEGSAQAKATPAATAPAGEVARSTFATDIKEREPLDQVTTLSNDYDRVFYFSELVNLDGRTVTHRWEWNGQLMAEVPISVGASRWRAYSSKNLHSSWLGEWKVTVVDQSGQVLAEAVFTYVETEEAPAAAEGGSPEPETPAAAPANQD